MFIKVKNFMNGNNVHEFSKGGKYILVNYMLTV